jgi:hypothetical protein
VRIYMFLAQMRFSSWAYWRVTILHAVWELGGASHSAAVLQLMHPCDTNNIRFERPAWQRGARLPGH